MAVYNARAARALQRKLEGAGAVRCVCVALLRCFPSTRVHCSLTDGRSGRKRADQLSDEDLPSDLVPQPSEREPASAADPAAGGYAQQQQAASPYAAQQAAGSPYAAPGAAAGSPYAAQGAVPYVPQGAVYQPQAAGYPGPGGAYAQAGAYPYGGAASPYGAPSQQLMQQQQQQPYSPRPAYPVCGL